MYILYNVDLKCNDFLPPESLDSLQQKMAVQKDLQ